MQEKKTVYVSGMTCATCAKTVEKALAKTSGVSFATVNLATGSAFVLSDKPVAFEVLQQSVRNVGYDLSERRHSEKEREGFGGQSASLLFALVITVPMSLLMLLHMSGFSLPHFVLAESLAGVVLVLLAGRKTLRGAWIALRHWHSNMDTLVSLGTLTALSTSWLHLSGLPIASFGTIGMMILTLHLVGRYLEHRLKQKATRQIRQLMELQPAVARVRFSGEWQMVPVENVLLQQRVKVLSSERIPLDGVVVEGFSGVDESMVSGEPLPVEKGPGDPLTGGSLNLGAPLEMEVTRVGDALFLNRMISLVQEAQGTRVPIQAVADRVTLWFVPTVFLLAVASALFWFFAFPHLSGLLQNLQSFLPWIPLQQGALSYSVFVFVATLVIACPCALGLAVPMALVGASTVASRKRLVIRNAQAIQTLQNVEVVLFDKTGTLTMGKPSVHSHSLSERMFAVVSTLESNSRHPLGSAFPEGNPALSGAISDVQEIPGQGMRCLFEGKTLTVGKPKTPEQYASFLSEGFTVVEVFWAEKFQGYVVLEDPLRPETPRAIAQLVQRGMEPIMVTGDVEKTAQSIARRAGISRVFAAQMPADKLSVIHELQSQGRQVMMVGDGMNDAPALKASQVGVAMGSGTDIAMENADIVIVDGGIKRVVDALQISRITFAIIRQNLFWAFLYNVIAIPTAMAGLLHPAMAELAMAISSITVILNSMRIPRQLREKGGEKMEVYALLVPDMSCNHCKLRISKALSELGVNDFSVSLEEKKLTVRTDNLETVLHKLASMDYPAQILP
ncbi:MAG TPA: heavy metal translocating P-type ATPase [Thermotogota bacterium]|nr:heavy metal translocating P-type ATPase [Thermotogota bacterium]HRW91341.1 heavy metal translocating P-type ATPase [Thermotogota bacterium]